MDVFINCLSLFREVDAKFIIGKLNVMVYENTKDIFKLMKYNKDMYRNFLENETVWVNPIYCKMIEYKGNDNEYIVIHDGYYYYAFEDADAYERYIITLTGIINYTEYNRLNEKNILGYILIMSKFVMIGLNNGFIATSNPYE